MGKHPEPQVYRDNPDAVSMHITRDNYEYDAYTPSSDDPPSYSAIDPTPSSSSTANHDMDRPDRVAHLTDTYSHMNPGGNSGWRVWSNNKPVNRGEVTMRMDERLNDPDELYNYIMDYLRIIPPRPIVRIIGSHNEMVRRKDKKERERIIDFDLKFSFEHYLGQALEDTFWLDRVVDGDESVLRGSWRRTRVQGYRPGLHLDAPSAPTLKEWCNAFCLSPSKLKVFRISRAVEGLKQDYLKPQIEALIRSTNYRGRLDVSFPIEERAVDIYSPHVINRWRTGWVRYIFYFTFLWIFTWPILFFMTKRWDVYTVVWKFSSTNDQGPERRFASISEKQWFERHRNLIRNLALNRHQGDGTSYPTSDSALQGDGAPQDATPGSGNANADSAVRCIRGDVNVWNSVSSGRIDTVGWGADTC